MARRILLAALVGLLSSIAIGPADAASGTYLRLAHLSPDTPDVDVSVTSFSGTTEVLEGVGYGDVSSSKRIEPGTYTVSMRLAGAPASSPLLVTGTLEATDGSAYTVAGLGPRAALAVRVLTDDLAPPGPGQAKVDAIGNGDVPTGGIETGLGGSTPLSPTVPAVVVTLAAVGLLGVGLVRRARR